MPAPANGHHPASAAATAVTPRRPAQPSPPWPGNPRGAGRLGNGGAKGAAGPAPPASPARRRLAIPWRSLVPARPPQRAPAVLLPAGPPGNVTGLLGGLRRAALAAIAVLVAAASLVSFAESYRGLYDWAAHHGVPGIWVAIWPLMVDVFIAVGELTLFVALLDRWPARARAGAWAVTFGGLAVSVAGNIGHVASHSLADRATAAVPPLAAAISLSVGMAVLKRVVAALAAPGPAVARSPRPVVPGPATPGPPGEAAPRAARAPASGSRGKRPAARRAAPPTVDEVAARFADGIAAGRLPSQREIRSEWHVGSDTARTLHGHLKTRLPHPAEA